MNVFPHAYCVTSAESICVRKILHSNIQLKPLVSGYQEWPNRHYATQHPHDDAARWVILSLKRRTLGIANDCQIMTTP